jgi:hypothetical protein
MRLDEDNADELFVRLIKQPRALIDGIDAVQPRTWSELRAIISDARCSCSSGWAHSDAVAQLEE